jgi:D-arabinitol dehydrogenase (NADP+)
MKLLKPRLGENILVIGMGPHGLILSQLANFSDAEKVAAIGLRQDRLDWLKAYGVPTILASRNDDSVHEAAIARMFPHGVDAIIDSAGSWSMVKSLFKFLRKGGRYLQYGSFHSAEPLDITPGMLNQLHYKEQQYISCSAQTYCFPQAIEYIANGKVRLDNMVSHVYPLDDYFKALEVNKTDKTAVKVIIHPNE